ncbi:MAG: glycosyltransferase family 87 protein [Parvularculaceae bacterium]
MKTAAAYLAERFPFVNELLTRRLALVVAAAAGLVLATNAAVYLHAVATAKDYVTAHGPVVGGDFVIFAEAAKAAGSGDAVAIYDPEALEARLKAAFPSRESFRVSWQYPPTMFLVIAPFAVAPFPASFFLWAFAAGALFLVALERVWSDRLALFAAIASPAAFQAFITGQTGFLTAALVATAAMAPDRRWILAGLAAGLLTVKPQLGLLLPVAFAAAGCWRAFGAAAVTGVVLAAASIVFFGAGAWGAFIEAMTAHGAQMQSAVFPFEKLVSAYGGAVMLGMPTSFALALQIAVSLGLAGFVAVVWRRVAAWDLRLAVVSSAALLVSPYSFYYEMTIALPALLVVARRGVETGWLVGERPAIACLWLAPMFILAVNDGPGIPLAFAASLATFLLAARRAMIAFAPLRADRAAATL